VDAQHVIHVTDQVVDSDHVKIGEVSAVSPTYLHVTSGLFGLGHEYYLPFDAIQEVEPGVVVIKVPARRIPELGWEQRPGPQPDPAQLGYYGTMPAPPVELAPLAPAPPPEAPSDAPAASVEEMHVTEMFVERVVVEPPESPPSVAPISELPIVGNTLCDVRGNQVGKITSVDNGYARTQSGFLGLGQRFYIPIDQIARCVGDCCYVNLTRDQMNAAGWSEKPAA